jgi:hypothetical protein
VSSAMALTGVEGIEADATAALWSNGLQPSANAVMALELPPQVRLTHFANQNVYSTCEITDPQHLRCVYNIPPRTGYQGVQYFVTSDVPGSYEGVLTVTMPGDEDPANDRTVVPITIRPLLDVGVRDLTLPPYVFGGSDATVPVSIFTGARAVSGVIARVNVSGLAQLKSASTGAGSCAFESTSQLLCPLGDLPANANVDLDVIVSAATFAGMATMGVTVAANGENNNANNQRSGTFMTAQPGDLAVDVGAAAVAATTGETFMLPSIRVTRSGGNILGGKLQFTLPADITIVSMNSALILCSGQTTVICDLPPAWPADMQTLQLDLRLRSARTGNFTINAHASAVNDFQPSNDDANIAVTVNAVTVSPGIPPPANGSKGGGGRIEWAVLCLLAGLALRRVPAGSVNRRTHSVGLRH